MKAKKPINTEQIAKNLKRTPAAITKAARGGRFGDYVHRDADGGYLFDSPAAEREFRKNTDPSRLGVKHMAPESAPTPPAASIAPDPSTVENPPAEEEIGDFQAARTRKEVALADMAELKFKEAAGELIPARDVERQLAGYLVNCKTRLLALTSRAKQALPHLVTADLEAFDALVREALEELAGPAHE